MDESMFEDIHEMAENTAYLKAVEEKDVSLEMWENLPPYSDLPDLENRLIAEGSINFNTIFHEPTGFYMIKCFLIADYAGDKALFVKDVESYKSMRFESARKKIARLIYRRYISPDELELDEADQHASVFVLAKQKKYLMLDEEEKSDHRRVHSTAVQPGDTGPEDLGEPTFAHRGAHPPNQLPNGTGLPPSHSGANLSRNATHSKAQQFLPESTSSSALAHLNPNALNSSSPANSSAASSGPGAASDPNAGRHSRGVSFESAVPADGQVLDPASRSSRPSLSRPQFSHLAPSQSGAVSVIGSQSHSASSAASGHGPDGVTSGSGGCGMESERSVVSMLAIGNSNNSLGVYGRPVQRVKEIVERDEAPQDLFDDLYKVVMDDLQMDVFPRFLKSEFYKKYIRTKHIETVKVTVKDFTTFRVLGRGGFGAVHACRKKNSGTIYAMKSINKKLVKVKKALDNVLEERTVLAMMDSNFVTNLKYGLQDEETLYLVMDLMLGGDLKFHLINAGRFTEKRARFYAAEVLLGLEHVHQKFVIYRDMKLENVLLDHQGHCKISDLGLAVVTKHKIKGYAGTPGYTSPEMIHNRLYGPGTDIFSYGVMLYRMLCGSKPFKGKIDRDLDKAVINRKPQFPKEIFSKDAIDLLSGLLQKQPDHRLGCGEQGIEEIKQHPFFAEIDWGLLEAGYMDPPFVPNRFDVNAASLKDIGDFDRAKYRHVKLDERFKHRVRNFEYVSIRGLQEEMVAVLEKVDEDINYEKFSSDRRGTSLDEKKPEGRNPCGKCVLL